MPSMVAGASEPEELSSDLKGLKGTHHAKLRIVQKQRCTMLGVVDRL